MTDNDLIKKYLSWDNSSLEELLQKHLQGIFSACYRVCLDEENASDITQNVVIKIMKWLKNFAFQSEFKTWYYKIAYNESINFLKKNRENFYLDERIETLPCENSVIEEIVKNDFAILVTNEINKLPLLERNIVLYYYYDDLKIKEISDILWINENTIKTKLSRSKKFLKSKLEIYERNN